MQPIKSALQLLQLQTAVFIKAKVSSSGLGELIMTALGLWFSYTAVVQGLHTGGLKAHTLRL